MSGPKKTTTSKPSTKRALTTKKTAKKASLLKRAARDPYYGPSSKQIEQSFKKGKTLTLDAFRGIIDWS